MPWSETSPMDQKLRFLSDYQRGVFSLAELCRLGLSQSVLAHGPRQTDPQVTHNVRHLYRMHPPNPIYPARLGVDPSDAFGKPRIA